MSLSALAVRDLRKVYRVPVREPGLRAALRGLVRRSSRDVVAVDGVTFAIEPGEMVGFLGPNGAGKTTVLKMLSGLLFPTSGEIAVLGYVPSKREDAFLRQITLVMGQRSQLAWDIPALDSFELNGAIYDIPPAEYRTMVDDMIDLLDLGELVKKPVRNLSLGERMKCEIAVALLHRPRVLFLDEPTIGLDVTMQRRIRAFIADYNYRHEATVLLTSHYMADIEALCRRVIVIHHGRILYDGDLTGLSERFSPHKTIMVDLEDGAARNGKQNLSRYGEVVSSESGRFELRVPKGETARVTGRILADLAVEDLTVQDPPIEDVIEQVFAQEPS
jgi:ABC-2 type transport system ATP-binding protein